MGRFVSADTVIPDFTNPQSLNRYSYVYNNSLRYTDPSGHLIPLIVAIPLLVAGAALITDWGIQVHDNMANRDMSFWDAAFHQNLDEGEMVSVGATAGVATAVALTAAPGLVAAAGQGLMGAGMATGSTALWTAGTTTVAGAGTLAATVWGVQQIGDASRLVVGGGHVSDFPELGTGDVSLNINPDAIPDAVGNISGAPFRTGSFQEVYFERVQYTAFTGQNSGALSESARVLQPGGRLIIETGVRGTSCLEEIIRNLGAAGFTNIAIEESSILRITAILGGG